MIARLRPMVASVPKSGYLNAPGVDRPCNLSMIAVAT